MLRRLLAADGDSVFLSRAVGARRGAGSGSAEAAGRNKPLNGSVTMGIAEPVEGWGGPLVGTAGSMGLLRGEETGHGA